MEYDRNAVPDSEEGYKEWLTYTAYYAKELDSGKSCMLTKQDIKARIQNLEDKLPEFLNNSHLHYVPPLVIHLGRWGYRDTWKNSNLFRESIESLIREWDPKIEAYALRMSTTTFRGYASPRDDPLNTVQERFKEWREVVQDFLPDFLAQPVGSEYQSTINTAPGTPNTQSFRRMVSLTPSTPISGTTSSPTTGSNQPGQSGDTR